MSSSLAKATQPEFVSGGLSQKGNFTQVPNELIEFLMNRKSAPLTSREYSIVFFLIRELQGWAYQFKPLELNQFASATGLAEQHVCASLKDLVAKKILVKIKVPGVRTPLYGFNEELFGRTVVTEPKTYFRQNSKVIDLVKFKITKEEELKLTRLVNEKSQKRAVEADEQVSKYTQIPLNTLSKGRSEKLNPNNWDQVKAALLEKFPNDADRLEGTFKQIQRNGFEQEGKPPRLIANIPAWLLASYKDIRAEYAHHDRRKPILKSWTPNLGEEFLASMELSK